MEIGILNTQIRPLAALPRQVLGRRSGAGWPQIFYFEPTKLHIRRYWLALRAIASRRDVRGIA